MINCVIETKDVINLIFSGIVAVSTVVYAVLTCRLVRETKAQRKAITEPRLSISLQPHSSDKMNIIELILENVGPGIAYDLTFKFITDYVYADHKKKLSEIGFFKSGLKVLAPNTKHKTYVGSALENINEKISNPIEIEVSYRNVNEEINTDKFYLDFSELIGLLYLKENDKFDLLSKSINDLTIAINNDKK